MAKSQKWNKSRFLSVLMVLAGVLLYTWYAERGVSQGVQPYEDSGQLLEVPNGPADRPQQILKRKNYTLSFNSSWNLPNWVAWDITKEELEDLYQRSQNFTADPSLAKSLAVLTEDYAGSGYDRGHMCPAGDNHYDADAMDECFYMTNICPQDHKLNAGAWNNLEMACRRWARRYGRVYVACGPIVDESNPKTIGRSHQVRVPAAFFKVILIMDAPAPIAIGYVFENSSSDHPYRACSVDEIEAITNIDFFPALPDDLEDEVEATFDESLWKW